MSPQTGGQPETATSRLAPDGSEAYFLWASWAPAKSTVGLALSRSLDWPFEDLDERIQAQERRSSRANFSCSRERPHSAELSMRALRSLIRDLSASPQGS